MRSTVAVLSSAVTALVLVASTSVARAECVETAPAGAERPQMIDTFPERGLSGYAATLHVVVSHGKGETVLPRGLDLQSDGDTAKGLKAAGFAFPDQDGGCAARVSSIDVDAKTGRRQTTLDLPLVALPTEPGRHSLVVPALPVSISRANNDVVTLCTKPHTMVVEDPTASTPNAQPKPNPPARLQREEWVTLERALSWTGLGVLVGGVLAWLLYRWWRRPKPVAPPPPPRPPWEIAFERLDEVRHAGLLETQRFPDFFDRVNDAVRQYLGARFGFDGLECTTDETLAALRRAPHFGLPLPELAAFLQECDLVKFADFTPTLEECERSLVAAERIRADHDAPRPRARSLRARTGEHMMRARAARGSLVALGTLAALSLALVGPVLARGDAWRSAMWSAWPGPLGSHPSTADALGWLARAGWVVFLVVALLSVPYVVWRMTLGADARVPRLGLPTILALVAGPRGWRTPLRDVPGMLRGAALVMAVLALGRPQSVLRGETEEEKGIDIVLVLDLSGSMSAVMDAPTNELVPSPTGRGPRHRATRLDVAKDVLIDFVRRRKTDRIGVVVFAKQAFVLSPPTLDYALITSLVSRIELGVIDSNKTAIGDAVGTAVARMRRSDAHSKAVVLLTDGDSNEGVISPEYSAHLAQKEGVRVYTVQIGNGDDVDVQTGTDLFGQPVYERKHFPVNPELLGKMAKETGGESFIATDKSGLEKSMHSILDHLEKTRFESQASTMEDLFPLLLVPAAVLLALESLIRLVLVRRFP